MLDPVHKFFDYRKQVSCVVNDPGTETEKKYEWAPKIELPIPYDISAASLLSCLNQRKSARAYGNKPIASNKLATLLHMGFGAATSGQRTFPSGGGLYPSELYVGVLKSEDLSTGVYHFVYTENILERIAGEDILRGLIGTYPRNRPEDSEIIHASTILFITFSRNRNYTKYKDHAYRLGYMEVGHIAQNMYLLSAALGLGCRATTSWDIELVNKVLYVDGINETLVYSVIIG